MTLVEVAASVSMLIVSTSLLIWVIKFTPKSKEKQREEEPQDVQLDAATSLHRALDELRNTKFGRPMHPRSREFDRRG